MLNASGYLAAVARLLEQVAVTPRRNGLSS